MKTFQFKINEKTYDFIIETNVSNPYHQYSLIIKDIVFALYPIRTAEISVTNIVNKMSLYNDLHQNILIALKSMTKNHKIVYGRSNTISKILTNFIHNDYIEKIGLTKENIKDFSAICKKVNYPRIKIKKKFKKRQKLSYIRIKDWHSNMPMYDLSEMYLSLKKFTSQEELNFIINDLKKFDRGFVKYILQNKYLTNFCSFNEYNNFVKSCPKWLKKSKYNLSFFTYKPEMKAPFNPTNRWEYWVLATLYSDYINERLNMEHDCNDLALKIVKAGKKSFDLWKKLRNINHAYNKSIITQYFYYLFDSERLYSRYKDIPNCEFRPLSGSGKNFIDIVENNHRLEVKYRKQLAEEELKIKLRTVKELCEYEPLESYRLKTNGDLVNAGRECHHCIGNYVNDKNSLFYRKGDVCAQVSINTKRVEQCWDKYNKKTDASREFEQYLIEHINKAYQNVVSVSMNREYVTALNHRGQYANIA